MDTTQAYALARRARDGQAGVDSSKLRGSTVRQVQTDGVLAVEKYHQTVAFLSSAEVFDELLAGADLHARLMRDLPLAAHLLSTALKLGVSPDRAVTALIVQDEAGPRVDVAHLMAIIDDAADDLEGAALAAERLAQPTDSDISLDDFAAELGIDIAQIRADVAARSMRPQFAG